MDPFWEDFYSEKGEPMRNASVSSSLQGLDGFQVHQRSAIFGLLAYSTPASQRHVYLDESDTETGQPSYSLKAIVKLRESDWQNA